MSLFIDIISWGCILCGGFLGVTGAIGLFRFPDFYTRLHAASITDTLCAGLIIFGLILQAGFTLMSLKLLMLLGIFAYTAPTASHILAKTAFKCGLKPVLYDQKGGGS